MANFHRQHRMRRLGRVVLFSLLLLSTLMSLSGCTRRFFRRRADAEVDAVLAQKDKYPEWKIDDYYVYPHPLSRFADPTNPDRSPMPPDDPAAWDLSPHPQKAPHRGVKYNEGTGYLDLMRKWDAENRAKKDAELAAQPSEEEGAEPLLPGETKTFAQRAREVDEQIERELNSPTTTTKALPESFGTGQAPACKPFLLNMEQTTELGFLNSQQFQSLREGLYLSALPVTAERFAFIAQPFATEQIIRERSGSQSPDGQTNRWLFNSATGFSKLFSTGALLLLNFANTTVYNLGGGAPGTTSVSNVSLDFIQPFLAGGGRAVALEPLTQAERNLLYAIRDFYRSRQEFFVFFAAGQSTFIPGVQAGVQALLPGTVTTPNPFVPGAIPLPATPLNPATPQVPPQTLAAGPILGSGITLNPQGYLSTLAQRGVLVNSYKNIQALQRFLRLFEVYLEGGIVNQVQKGQIEQTLLRSIENVLGSHVSYRVSLDQLKQQLGLPMTVPIELDPAPLQPMIDVADAYEKLSIDFERVVYNMTLYGNMAEAKQMRKRLHRLIERTPLLRGLQIRERILNRWNYWEQFEKGKPDRLTNIQKRMLEMNTELNRLRSRQTALEGKPLPEAEQRRQEELTFEYDAASLEFHLSSYEREPWKAQKKDPQLQASQHQTMYRRVNQFLLYLVDRAVGERQEKIKSSWPALPALCAEGTELLSATEEEALGAAQRTTLDRRLDLMNIRGQLVDAWRKIRVSANALLGTFNVDYHLDASSPLTGARPFALGGSRTRHELIFNTQLPLVRILQRNNYRSTLINYQQFRRNLMGYEDQLLFNVRFDLRQLRATANNYHRVQKRQIELAYLLVDQALQAFSQPQAPVGADIAGLVGPVAPRPAVGDPAALTTQLLNTQSSLLSAQNDLYNTWIGYLTTRMALYRDMGVMPLDNRGVWIDDNTTSCSSNAACASQSTGGQQPAGQPEQLPTPPPEELPPPHTGGTPASTAMESRP